MAMQPPQLTAAMQPKFTYIAHHELDHSGRPTSPVPYITKRKLLNTIIIFDWDDTLLPSAKLVDILARPNQYNDDEKSEILLTDAQKLASNMTKQERIQLMNMSYITYLLLSQYIKQYTTKNICIVSTSGPGWVKRSLDYVYEIGYYSRIYHLLFDKKGKDIKNNISIYRPSIVNFETMKREMQTKNTEDLFMHLQLHWKTQVFKRIFDEKARISGNSIINTFVIIGDSAYEYEAAKELKECIDDVYGHLNFCIFVDRIKLKESPSIGVLMDEQNVLLQLGENRFYENHSLLNQNGFDLDYIKEKSKPSSKFFLKKKK